MKRLLILKIAFISMITFTVVGGYFWYLYFDESEAKMVADNVRLELLNNGSTTYINAIAEDKEENIPTYYFRVKNNFEKEAKYTLLFNEITPNEANDGCSSSTSLKMNELSFELKLDNKIIKSGKLNTLKNNVLDDNTVQGKSTNDYSLRVYISDDTTDTLKKHYHYSVIMKDENEKVS